MKSKLKLSVVLLNYNAGDYLVNCLESLQSTKNDLELDIWVVDNASTDDSLKKAKKRFPEIQIINNTSNVGFSKGNNCALSKIKNENILILNYDTKIPPGTLQTMVGFMEEHPDVGAASCLVELADGSIDWASHRGFPTPWASFLYYILGDDALYHLAGRDMSTIHEVDSLSGAFLMTRKSVLDKVGLFDEDYFMYAEDIDLCFRIKKAGLKIMYVPGVKIIHYKGVASGIKQHSQEITTASSVTRINAFNAFYETMKTFYRKNLANRYPFFINWLVYLTINLKWFLAKRKMQV